MIQYIEICKLKEHEENTLYFDDIIGVEFEELKGSIAELGIIDPLTVKETRKEEYTIISGNQRFRASKEIGLEKLPCIIRKFNSKKEEVQFMIEANLRRRHLTTTQKAKAIYKLYELTDGKNKKDRVKKLAKKSEYGQRNTASLISIEEKMIPELKPIIDKGNVSINKAGSIANASAEIQYLIYEKLKDVAAEDVKDELQKVYEENSTLSKKAEKAEKKYKKLKSEMARLTVRGNAPLSENDAGLRDIALDIVRINSAILDLVRKCKQYNTSLKELKMADYKEVNCNLFDNYYPPATPLFRLIEKEDLEEFIENSKDAEKVEEMYKEQVLNFLD